MYYQQISRIHILLDTKKYNEAKKLINECLADYPDSADLYALISRIALAENDPKKAMQAIETAISLDADTAEFHYLKAVILGDQAQLEKALEEINLAISIDPYVATFYGQKGYLLLRKNKKPEAIRWAKHGKSIDPTDDMSTNVLSMALSSSGDTFQAEEVLGEKLSENPEDEFTLSTAGFNQLRQGNIDQAKQLFQSALMINPESHYAKAGMMEAIKGSNFFYRKILQYQAWMEKKSDKNQWVFIVGILIVVNIIPILLPLYMIFILWIWFAPPIANMVLYLDKHGRYLMNEELSLITKVNLVITSLTIISIFVLSPFISFAFLGLAFALFVSIVPTNMIYSRHLRRNKLAMMFFAGTFILLGIIGTADTIATDESSLMWGVLIVYIVLFTWLANVFSR